MSPENTCVLHEAYETVYADRMEDYGSPEDNWKRIAEFWSTYLDTEVVPSDVAYMMVLLKVARSASGDYKHDNNVDIAGYAEGVDMVQNNAG